MRALGKVQRLLLIVGCVLIAIYATGRIYRTVMSRAALRKFEDLHAERARVGTGSSLDASALKVDFSLWSEKRVAAYERSLAPVSYTHLTLPTILLV